MIALGNDHTGYELKMEIIKYLEEKGIEYKDFGCGKLSSSDYPVYAKAGRLKQRMIRNFNLWNRDWYFIAANKMKGTERHYATIVLAQKQ